MLQISPGRLFGGGDASWSLMGRRTSPHPTACGASPSKALQSVSNLIGCRDLAFVEDVPDLRAPTHTVGTVVPVLTHLVRFHLVPVPVPVPVSIPAPLSSPRVLFFKCIDSVTGGTMPGQRRVTETSTATSPAPRAKHATRRHRHRGAAAAAAASKPGFSNPARLKLTPTPVPTGADGALSSILSAAATMPCSMFGGCSVSGVRARRNTPSPVQWGKTTAKSLALVPSERS